jgi:hypothetical protein
VSEDPTKLAQIFGSPVNPPFVRARIDRERFSLQLISAIVATGILLLLFRRNHTPKAVLDPSEIGKRAGVLDETIITGWEVYTSGITDFDSWSKQVREALGDESQPYFKAVHSELSRHAKRE